MNIKEDLNKNLSKLPNFSLEKRKFWIEFLNKDEIKKEKKLYFKLIKEFLLEFPFNNYDIWIKFLEIIKISNKNKVKEFEDLIKFFNKNNLNYWEFKDLSKIENKKEFLIYFCVKINKNNKFYEIYKEIKIENDFKIIIDNLINEFNSCDLNKNEIYLDRKNYEDRIYKNKNLIDFIEYIKYLKTWNKKENIKFYYELFVEIFYKENNFWENYFNDITENDLFYKISIYKNYRKILLNINKKYLIKELLINELENNKQELIIIENEIKNFLKSNFFIYSEYFNRLIRIKDDLNLKLIFDNLLSLNFYPEEKSLIIFNYINYLKQKNEDNENIILEILHTFISNEEFNLSLYNIYFSFIFKELDFEKSFNLFNSQNKIIYKKLNNNFKKENTYSYNNLIKKIIRRNLFKIENILKIEELIK